MRRALAPYPGTGTRQLSLGFQTQPPARGDLHIDPGLVVCNVHLSAAFDDTATAFWRLRPTPARSDDDAVEACVGEPPPPPCTPTVTNRTRTASTWTPASVCCWRTRTFRSPTTLSASSRAWTGTYSGNTCHKWELNTGVVN